MFLVMDQGHLFKGDRQSRSVKTTAAGIARVTCRPVSKYCINVFPKIVDTETRSAMRSSCICMKLIVLISYKRYNICYVLYAHLV